MPPVLLSRTLDPLLGIATGIFAFYLYENNPRTAPPEDQKLSALIRWKLGKRHQEKAKKEADAEKDIPTIKVDE